MGINARLFCFALEAAFTARHRWGSVGKIKVALLHNDGGLFAINQDTHQKWEDISAYEIAATNYVAGGNSLNWAGSSWSYTALPTPGGTMNLLGDNITFTSLTTNNPIRYAVVYTSNGNVFDSPLLGFVDFGANTSLTEEDFVIEWTNGIVASISLETADPAAPLGRLFGASLISAFEGSFDWSSGVIKAALLKTDFAPNQDTMHFWRNDGAGAYNLSDYELSATGNYTRKIITSCLVNYIDTADPGGRTDFVADNVTWSNLTSSHGFQWIVIYLDTGTPTSDPLLGYIKLSVEQNVIAQNVTVAWDSGVVFQVSLDNTADV